MHKIKDMDDSHVISGGRICDLLVELGYLKQAEHLTALNLQRHPYRAAQGPASDPAAP